MAAETTSAPGGGEAVSPLDWPSRIEEALARDLFVLHGQRIVDVLTGATMRHELFLRMVGRQRLIPAGEFVMAAEEFGSIRAIDRWVAARAIEVAATGRPVHLNLSLRSTDGAMLELLRDQLDSSGADPGNLVLELGERQLVAAPEAQRGFIRVVSNLGCRIALDGFIEGGRGAFLLKRFPINYVKLGPDLMEDLDADPAKRRAVSEAVLTAHKCGQRVIAQGVERMGILQLLEGLGIDEAQGFVLGPPESLDSLLGTPV
jgi:EAL domain-containing protein (putative c-di-GMP-specific phosphodiesterase class I)